jgi:rhodanese-related sulfurtransferase
LFRDLPLIAFLEATRAAVGHPTTRLTHRQGRRVMKVITRKQLQQKINDKQKSNVNDMTIINTLPEDQFAETRIPGAINIPEKDQQFVERVTSAVGNDMDAEIVVYCANRECKSSTNAAKKLDDAGFTHVFDYEEGAQDWRQAQAAPKMNA